MTHRAVRCTTCQQPTGEFYDTDVVTNIPVKRCDPCETFANKREELGFDDEYHDDGEPEYYEYGCERCGSYVATLFSWSEDDDEIETACEYDDVIDRWRVERDATPPHLGNCSGAMYCGNCDSEFTASAIMEAIGPGYVYGR